VATVDAPSSLYSSWTNSSSILERGIGNFEFNQQFSAGPSGPGVTSQLSMRLGVAKRLELGLVGNLTLGSPETGTAGVTAHLGTSHLDPEHYRSGALFQVTGGTGSDPTGATSGVVAASASYLAARGGDTASRETDFNAGASYATFGSFGSSSTSVPHLLTAPFLAARTWYLDPQHANSTFLEGQVAPAVAIGTLGGAAPLYGARLGVGVGFSTSATNSLLTLSGNAFVDITSRGAGAGGMLSVTYGGRGVIWKAPDE
jgi:hypothetical protein